jgi:spore maturation protein A
MNAIFAIIVISSAAIMCLTNADMFITTCINGAMQSAQTLVTLFCIYTVWMGICRVAEDANITASFAKRLAPLCKKIFKCDDELTIKYVATNLSCNLLGIGGAATPYGVKAVERMERVNNEYGQNLLFIINATSIQLIPSTVIAIRAASGSMMPSDIVLPSLIATAFSTLFASLCYVALNKLCHL